MPKRQDLRERTDAFHEKMYQQELEGLRAFAEKLGEDSSHIHSGKAEYNPPSYQNPTWMYREVDAERIVQTLREEGLLEGFDVAIVAEIHMSVSAITISW